MNWTRRLAPLSVLALWSCGTEPPVEVVGFTVALDDTCAVCAMASVTLDRDGSATLYLGEAGAPAESWVVMGPATQHQIPVLELRPDTDYLVYVEIEGPQGEQVQTDPLPLRTGPLPADLPPLQILAHTPEQSQPGLTVFTIGQWDENLESTVNYVVATDEDGVVVWYQSIDGLALGLEVDEWQRIYTTETVQRLVRIDPFGQTSATWETADLGLDTAHHEVRGLANDGFALLSSEVRAIPGWTNEAGEEVSYNIVGDLLVTLDAEGQTTWRWSLLDHLNPLEQYTDDLHNPFWQNLAPYDVMDTVKDWSHGNAMVPSDDGWLGSFRNLDWLIQVNPADDQIQWVFGPNGDFELAEGGRWFSRQHAPKVLPNGNILLYDNGNARADAAPTEPPWSRVVEYALDTDTYTATEVWSYAGPSTYFCPVVGNVELLANGNRLITDGALLGGFFDEEGNPIAHFSARIREVDDSADPQIAWELEVGSPDDPEAEAFFVYRAVRIDSLYPEMVRPR